MSTALYTLLDTGGHGITPFSFTANWSVYGVGNVSRANIGISGITASQEGKQAWEWNHGSSFFLPFFSSLHRFFFNWQRDASMYTRISYTSLMALYFAVGWEARRGEEREGREGSAGLVGDLHRHDELPCLAWEKHNEAVIMTREVD